MSDKKTQDEIEISDSKKSSDKESVNEGGNSSASNHKFKKGNGKGSSKGRFIWTGPGKSCAFSQAFVTRASRLTSSKQ